MQEMKKSGLFPILGFRSQHRFLVPCHNSGCSVVIEFGLDRFPGLLPWLFFIMTMS